MIPSLPIRVFPEKSTLICSIASGDQHIAMMQIMAPTVSCYAAIHGMDCLLLPLSYDRLDPTRPVSWDKIILIRHMLEIYETVIWIDADAIIRDPWRDFRQVLQPSFSMFLTFHHIFGTIVPNCGVMVLKSNTDSINLLEAIWSQTEFINHAWWEQAAFINLIGFEAVTPPVYPYRGETQFSHLVWVLGNEWNSVFGDLSDDPVIMHYAGVFPYEQRIKGMHTDLDIFLSRLMAK